MIIDLAGPAAAHRAPLPASVQRLLRLDIEHAIVGRQRRQQGRYPLEPALFVRRIEEHYIKTRSRRRPRGGEFYRIRGDNFQTSAGIEQTDVGGKRREGRPRILDQHDPDCPARCRFDPQGAAAGEEIEAGKPGQILAQPVEQGFANAIRRRAQTLRIRKAQHAPPPFAPNDAYCIQFVPR